MRQAVVRKSVEGVAVTPATEPTKSKQELVYLLLIMGLALAVRYAHFFSIVWTAFPKLPLVFDQSDLNTYWEWAQAILAGDWLGRDTYHPAFDWMKAIAPQETWYQWWGGKAIFQQAPLY